MPGKFTGASLVLTWLVLSFIGNAQAGEKGGPKDPSEDVTLKMLGHLEKMAEALRTMKNKESAAAARETVKEQVLAILKLRARAKELPPPSRALRERLATEYKKKFEAVQETLKLEVARVRAFVSGGREALTEVVALLYGKEKDLEGLEGKEPKEKEKDKE